MEAIEENVNGQEVEDHYKYEKKKNTDEKILKNAEKDAAQKNGTILQSIFKRLSFKSQQKGGKY